jgi:AraC-like DNA-binding protein
VLLKNSVENSKGLLYANAYLSKAKNDKDTIRMGDAYCYLIRYHNYEDALLFADTLILVTKNIKGNSIYPAASYLEYGNLYFLEGEYLKALDQYLIGIEYEKNNNDDILHSILHVNIGLLKNLMGDRSEALIVFRDYVKFLRESDFDDKEFYLLNGLINLGESYLMNHKNDSAANILKEGIELSQMRKDEPMYAQFLIYYGSNLFCQNDFNIAIDSLIKGILVCKDKNTCAYGNLFVAKSFNEINKFDEAIFYYSKVDSFLSETNNVTPELLEAYPVLIDFYAENKEMEKELYYTKNLLKFSAILEKSNQYLSKNIAAKYDIPKLLASKEDLIAKLNKDKFLSNRNLIVLGFVTVLFLGLIIYYYWKNNIYKRRFNAIMKQFDETQNISDPVNIIFHKEKSNDISDALVQNILMQLDKFEQSNKFTKKSYTLVTLAKELNTNGTYLSKVIDDKRGVNFATYLNDLRVNFAVKSLKTNKQLRAFTIEAMSQEFGFNNAQSFSSAFHKRTGIYPSYFMKQLEN